MKQSLLVEEVPTVRSDVVVTARVARLAADRRFCRFLNDVLRAHRDEVSPRLFASINGGRGLPGITLVREPMGGRTLVALAGDY